MRPKLPRAKPPREGFSGASEPPGGAGEFSARGLLPKERLLLLDWCASLGIPMDEPSMDRLGLYRELLLDWNARMNLTSMRDPRDVLIKHFLDSLAILPWVPEGDPVLDVGTGAGFPGMVLKLVRLSQPMTLVEATGKKIGFLEHLRRVFGLETCDILHRRLSGGEAGLRGRFRVVVSRGIRISPEFLRWAGSYLEPGGRFLAMAGKEVPSVESGYVADGGSVVLALESAQRFELPEKAGTRHLLIFQASMRNVPRGT